MPDAAIPVPSLSERLRQRAALLRQTRAFFDDAGFLEVQPPCLSRDCVVDAHLDPIAVPTRNCGLKPGQRYGDGQAMPEMLFLQTSPESLMKRMLAAGAPSLYAISPVFRSGEIGDRHNIEFTMLEWYERGGDYASAMDLTDRLVQATLQRPPARRIEYRQLLKNFTGTDPIEGPIEGLFPAAAAIDLSLARSIAEDRDSLLDLIMSHHIQPTLGYDQPIVVTHFPITQAALARRCPTDDRCALRFEIFVDGLELANGYDELLDADELESRYYRCNQVRQITGREPLHVDTTLLEAMRRGLPACSGVALGLDRLHMVQAQTDKLSDVLAFTTGTA